MVPGMETPPTSWLEPSTWTIGVPLMP